MQQQCQLRHGVKSHFLPLRKTDTFLKYWGCGHLPIHFQKCHFQKKCKNFFCLNLPTNSSRKSIRFFFEHYTFESVKIKSVKIESVWVSAHYLTLTMHLLVQMCNVHTQHLLHFFSIFSLFVIHVKISLTENLATY